MRCLQNRDVPFLSGNQVSAVTFPWTCISLRSQIANILWRQLWAIDDAAIAHSAVAHLGMEAAKVDGILQCLKQWASSFFPAHRADRSTLLIDEAHRSIPLTLQMKDTTVGYGSAIALKLGAKCGQATAIAQLIALATTATHSKEPQAEPIQNLAHVPDSLSPTGAWLAPSDLNITSPTTGWLTLEVRDWAIARWLSQFSGLSQLVTKSGDELPPSCTNESAADRALIWQMQRTLARCETLQRLAMNLPTAASHDNEQLGQKPPYFTKSVDFLPENSLKLSQWLCPEGLLRLSEPCEWAMLETLIRLVDQCATVGLGAVPSVTDSKAKALLRSQVAELCERSQAIDATCRILSPATSPQQRGRWVQWMVMTQGVLSGLLVSVWHVRPIRNL